MKAMRLSAAVAALTVVAGAAAAQEIPCGTEYVVQRGDTLSILAERAYDNSRQFSQIYNANIVQIGGNPGVIEVGSRLFIPCLDQALRPSTASVETIREEPAVEDVEPVEERVITIVTGSDRAPLQNEDQEQGGMFTEIMNVALGKVIDTDGYKIDFIKDYGAHLQPLIADLHYDLSFAWYRPNCDVIERLGPDSQFRCNNLNWSEPVYEQIVGFYTRADAAQPLSYADTFGTTVCRPDGFATFMLEEHGLVEPNVTLVRPSSLADCFEGLARGDYDMAVAAVDVAEGLMVELGAEEQIVRNDVLDTVSTLNVVTSKNNPAGLEMITMVNEGLAEIKDNGEWFEIVRRHLAQHRAR